MHKPNSKNTSVKSGESCHFLSIRMPNHVNTPMMANISSAIPE